MRQELTKRTGPAWMDGHRILPFIKSKKAQLTGSTDTYEKKLRNLEKRCMNDIMKQLQDYFPDRHFLVRVDLKQGWAMIGLNLLHNAQEGYKLDMRECLSNPNTFRKRILAAGGELLDRFGLSASRKFNHDAWDDIKKGKMLQFEASIPS